MEGRAVRTMPIVAFRNFAKGPNRPISPNTSPYTLHYEDWIMLVVKLAITLNLVLWLRKHRYLSRSPHLSPQPGYPCQPSDWLQQWLWGRDSSLHNDRSLSFIQNFQTDTGPHPTSYLMGVRGPFRGAKRTGREPNMHFHPLPKETICGATPQSPRGFFGVLNEARLPLDHIPCKIWSSHSDVYENSHLLGNNTVHISIGLQVQHFTMLFLLSKLS